MNDGDVLVALVDIVISVTLLEGALLAWLRLRAGRGPALADVGPNLGAGLCLLGALHTALTQQGWWPCAAWLAAAGVSHGLDVRRRWPRATGALSPEPVSRALRRTDLNA